MLGGLGGAQLWTSLGSARGDKEEPSRDEDSAGSQMKFRGVTLVDPLRRNVPARPARAPDLKSTLASDLKPAASPPWSGVAEYTAESPFSASKTEAHHERGRAIGAVERLQKQRYHEHQQLPLHRQLDEDAPSASHQNTPPGTLRGRRQQLFWEPAAEDGPETGRKAVIQDSALSDSEDGGPEIEGREEETKTDMHLDTETGAAAIKEGQKLTEQTMMACLTLCHALHDQLQKDVLSVETATCANSGFSTKSTVGIMLNGKIIENMVVGGPAYNTRQIERGDEIMLVDGQEAHSVHELQALLRGDDAPGSSVSVHLMRPNGEEITVSMKRMATEEIADKRKMLELFTLLENFVESSPDTPLDKHDSSERGEEEGPKAQALQTVDEAIQLWSKMLLADAEHDDTIAANITAVQTKSKAILAGLVHQVKTLPSSFYSSQRPVVAHFQRRIEALSADLEDSKRMLAVQMGEHKEHDAAVSLVMGQMNQLQDGIARMRACEEAALDARGGVLCSLIHHKTKASCFVSWRSWALGKQQCLRGIERAGAAARRSSIAAAVSRWQGYAMLRKRQRGIELRWSRRRKAVGLARSMQVWRGAAHAQRSLFLRTRRVVVQWMQKSCSRALQGWRQAVDNVKRTAKEEGKRTQMLEGALRRSMRQALGAGLDAWRQHVKEQRRARLLARKVVLRYLHRAQFRALKSWRANVSESRRCRQLMTRAVARLNGHAVGTVFSRWASNVNTHVRKHQLMLKVGRRIRAQHIAPAFTRWHEYTDVRMAYKRLCFRVIQRMVRRVVCTALGRWSEYLSESRRMKKTGLTVVRRFRRVRLVAALERWRECMVESAAVGSCAKTVVKRWRGSALGKSFEKWSNVVEAARWYRQSLGRMLARMRSTSLFRAYAAWHANTRQLVHIRAQIERILLRMLHSGM